MRNSIYSKVGEGEDQEWALVDTREFFDSMVEADLSLFEAEVFFQTLKPLYIAQDWNVEFNIDSLIKIYCKANRIVPPTGNNKTAKEKLHDDVLEACYVLMEKLTALRIKVGILGSVEKDFDEFTKNFFTGIPHTVLRAPVFSYISINDKGESMHFEEGEYLFKNHDVLLHLYADCRFFNFEDYKNLKSKYSRRLYYTLAQHLSFYADMLSRANTVICDPTNPWAKTSVAWAIRPLYKPNALRQILACPDTMKSWQIATKVLRPIVEEFQNTKIFKGIYYDTELEVSKGAPISGYVFDLSQVIPNLDLSILEEEKKYGVYED